MHLFPEDSCYLPDSKAFELLGRQCHFCPKEIIIRTHIFSTFFQRVDQETPDLSLLVEYFKEVESLTICGIENEDRFSGPWGSEHDFRQPTRHPEIWQTTEVVSALLRLIVSTGSPKLTSLSIKRFQKVDDFAPSIAPILTSSYNGLQKLHITEEGSVTLDIPSLITITKHQHLLHTVSIKLSRSYPQEELKSWIQVCLKKPLLERLELSLKGVALEVMLRSLVMFFMTPCMLSPSARCSNSEKWVTAKMCQVCAKEGQSVITEMFPHSMKNTLFPTNPLYSKTVTSIHPSPLPCLDCNH